MYVCSGNFEGRDVGFQYDHHLDGRLARRRHIYALDHIYTLVRLHVREKQVAVSNEWSN
jgi:hypothetical protein